MKRRIFASLLAGAMILSLTACGGKGDNGGSSTGGSSSGQADASLGSSAGNASSTDGSQPAASTSPEVNLSSFYSDITGKYEFGALALADNDILDALYPGLSDIGLEQMQVYYCLMSMNNGEFGLVQVKDGKDVDAVKGIFQDRIQYMVGDGNGPGGAQYPMAMDQWENNSRVVANGGYVMMVVHENADDIVEEFNALFE